MRGQNDMDKDGKEEETEKWGDEIETREIGGGEV